MKTCLYGLDILFLSPMSDMQDYNKPYPGRSHELFLVTLLILLGWVSEDLACELATIFTIVHMHFIIVQPAITITPCTCKGIYSKIEKGQ